MKFDTAVVVDAVDLPKHVDDWCVDNDIATHYEHSLAMIWCEQPKDNPLLRWLIDKRVDIVKHSRSVYGEAKMRCYYVAIIGT